MGGPDRLTETIERMIRERVPNLFRLYANPHVVQACLCLERYIQAIWRTDEPYQSFVANSFDEALSGAIKLARFCATIAGKPTTGLVFDPANRLGPFASSGNVVFVPGLTAESAAPPDQATFGFVVLVADATAERRPIPDGALMITCVSRQSLN